MILIPPLRTKRLNVTFKEISIGDAIRLAGIHPRENERATTEFLNVVIESATKPTDLHVTDPRMWSVQERTLAVCHYIAATADNENRDFLVGESGRLTDYMDTSRDYVAAALVGEAAEDHWRVVPLTGLAAEMLERLESDGVDGISPGRMHWVFGCMAAQLQRVDAKGQLIEEPPPESDAALTDWLRDRMRVLAGFPESQFVQLLRVMNVGMGKIGHLFNMEPAADGLVCLPVRKGEGGELPPARFPVDECLGPMAHQFAQQLPKPSP